MTLTSFGQYLCDSSVCLVFASNLPHITEYCIRVWSCHVIWAGLRVHLDEGVLCVRRVRCVSYWGCVRICVSVTSACLALTDRVCVWDGGCECFLWVGGICFFPIIPAGLRSPLCSHAHILHSFLLQHYHTPSSGFGRQIFPPLRLQNSLFLSRNPLLFPLTQLGRDCRDYRLLVTVMCARVCVFTAPLISNRSTCIISTSAFLQRWYFISFHLFIWHYLFSKNIMK